MLIGTEIQAQAFTFRPYAPIESHVIIYYVIPEQLQSEKYFFHPFFEPLNQDSEPLLPFSPTMSKTLPMCMPQMQTLY